MRYALIATLVALAAVVAGAQAASGANDDSALPRTSTPTRVEGGSPKDASTEGKRLAVPVSRAHNGNDDLANRLNLQAVMTSSACRTPNICYLTGGDDNVGATVEAFEEDSPGSQQADCGGVKYDSTVWYGMTATRPGALYTEVINTSPDSPDPFLPVFRMFSSVEDFCIPSFVSTNVSTISGEPVNEGEVIAIAVGARLTDSTCSGICPQGDYFDIGWSWDPDTDRDGLRDSQESCDTTPGGPNGIAGCPDADNDNTIDNRDDCDGRGGPARPAPFNACPDSDGDGKPDRNDRGQVADVCQTESTVGQVDRNNNGCPDFKALPDLTASGSGFINRRLNLVAGFKFRRLKFKGKLPKGTKVRIRCKPRRACKIRKRGSLKKRLGRVRFSTNKRKKKQKVKITISARKAGYVGKVFSFSVFFKRNSAGGRNVDSTSIKKRCIPATGGKTRKCSSSLLLR